MDGSLNITQALALARFGNNFQVKNAKFWRHVQNSLNEVIPKYETHDQLLKAVTYLKEVNLVSNGMMRTISGIPIEQI
jgi:hypothetical protein